MTESNSPLRWADDEEDDDDDGEDGDEMLLPPPRLPLLSPPFRRCRRMKRSCRWRFRCAFCCAFCFAVLVLTATFSVAKSALELADTPSP